MVNHSIEVLDILGRSSPFFEGDLENFDDQITDLIESSTFLVIGAAGSIGQSVTKEIFRRNPKKLHAVDISENNLVELVRDIRSSFGYIVGEFSTFAIDCGSDEFAALLNSNSEPYDYVLNLSALKHVRSEKDPFTLMRLLRVNVLNTISIHRQISESGSKKYFCVSTDKATNPVNMMGASKRLMEVFLFGSVGIDVSTARFANVAFSDGSLLHGFNQRLLKCQPLSAPSDVRRYFLTHEESGQLCLISCLLGNDQEIFFPQLGRDFDLITFSEIAQRYLIKHNLRAVTCSSEEEARERISTLNLTKEWPCFFFESDTTGEKPFEEFYTSDDSLNLNRFDSIGVIEQEFNRSEEALKLFETRIKELESRGRWSRLDLVELVQSLVPEFEHRDTGKYLDSKM